MNKISRRTFLAAMAAASAAGMLTACGSSQAAASASSGTASAAGSTAVAGKTIVNVGIGSAITDISPFASPDEFENPIKHTLYQQLFTTQGVSGAELLPVVGKSYEMKDSVTADVTIFDNVHDVEGNPITADDVVYSYQQQIKANTQSDTSYIASVAKIDDHTFEMVLNSDSAGLVDKLLTHVPIVAQKAYEANPDQCPGTTAYKLTSFVSGSEIDVEKIDDYWQTDDTQNAYMYAANVDKIVFQCIPEATQTTIALEDGELQMAIGMDGKEAKRFEEGGEDADGFAVDTFASNFSLVFLLNDMESSPCHDINLRKAILYALDRQAIVDNVLSGAGVVDKDFCSDVLRGFNQDWLKEDYYDYNADKSKEALAASSYSGQKIQLQGESSYATVLELMQSQLVAAGIDCEITTFEQALWQQYKVAGVGEWDICVDGLGGSLVTTAWKVKWNPANFTTNLPQNGTSDTKVIELLNAAADSATYSPETIEAFHDYVVEQAYGIGLYSPAAKCVTVDTIKDICHSYQGYVCPAACDYSAYTVTE